MKVNCLLKQLSLSLVAAPEFRLVTSGCLKLSFSPEITIPTDSCSFDWQLDEISDLTGLDRN